MTDPNELIKGLEDTMEIGAVRERTRTLRLLKEELDAMRDLGESIEYIQGFEHAILLLEDTWN